MFRVNDNQKNFKICAFISSEHSDDRPDERDRMLINHHLMMPFKHGVEV